MVNMAIYSCPNFARSGRFRVCFTGFVSGIVASSVTSGFFFGLPRFLGVVSSLIVAPPKVSCSKFQVKAGSAPIYRKYKLISRFLYLLLSTLFLLGTLGTYRIYTLLYIAFQVFQALRFESDTKRGTPGLVYCVFQAGCSTSKSITRSSLPLFRIRLSPAIRSPIQSRNFGKNRSLDIALCPVVSHQSLYQP